MQKVVLLCQTFVQKLFLNPSMLNRTTDQTRMAAAANVTLIFEIWMWFLLVHGHLKAVRLEH